MTTTIIEKLLAGAEVEWKPLGEVALLEKGNIITAKSKIDGDIPVIAGGRAVAYYNGNFNRTGKTITISGSGAYAGHIMYWEIPIFVSDAFSIKANLRSLNIRYLFHFLLQKQIRIYNLKRGAGVPHVYLHDVAKILIPIPPLSVQKEIVRILDAFTAHTAKLTAELTAELNERQKQYNYYRDKLLTFSETEVEWKTLGETGTLIRGNGLQKKDLMISGVPAIHYGQIYTYYGTFAAKTKSFVSPILANKLKHAVYGDVLISATSETIEDILTPLGWLGKDIVFSGDMYAFRPSKIIDTKFLTYLLKTTNFQKYKKKYANGTKVIRVPANKLLDFSVPIPSLERQKQIVSILDKFEALTTSITEGLWHEIELRNKQYEYYRDQLLNFPKPEDKVEKQNVCELVK